MVEEVVFTAGLAGTREARRAAAVVGGLVVVDVVVVEGFVVLATEEVDGVFFMVEVETGARLVEAERDIRAEEGLGGLTEDVLELKAWRV